MPNIIPERLIGFRLYNDGEDLLGTVNIELPEITPMSETVSGAGVAGEYESGILGHYESMVAKITWRTIEPAAAPLYSQRRAHPLVAYGSQQITNAATGETTSEKIRVAMRAKYKGGGLGTFEVNAATDTEQEFEITYLKVTLNKRTIIEIDKLNFKAVFDGVDEMAKVRKDLGME